MKRCWALDPLGRPRNFQEIASALDSIEKRAGASSADQGGYYAAGFDNSTVSTFNVPNPIFSSNEQQEATTTTPQRARTELLESAAVL
jgi:hypothetical protein